MYIDKRLPVVGAENEVKVYNPDGKPVSFKQLKERMYLPHMTKHATGVMWEGGYIYEDYNMHFRGKKRDNSKLIEFSTHPVEMKKGCVSNLVDIVLFNIAYMATMSKGLNTAGYRRQYCYTVDSFIDEWNLGNATASLPIHPNVRESYKGQRSYRFDKYQVDLMKLTFSAIGPALALMFGNRGDRRLTLSPYYPGRDQRYKLELDTEFLLEPNQMKAALTFFFGCTKGFENMIKKEVEKRSMSDPIETFRQMNYTELFRNLPYIIEGIEFSASPLKAGLRMKQHDQLIQEFGSEAILKVNAFSGPRSHKSYNVTCLELIKEFASFFEEDIRSLSTKNEYKTLQRLINENNSTGKRKGFSINSNCPVITPATFETTVGMAPQNIIDGFVPSTLSSLYSKAYSEPTQVLKKNSSKTLTRQTIVKKTRTHLDWDAVRFSLELKKRGKTETGRIYVLRDYYKEFQSMVDRIPDPEDLFSALKGEFPWM